MHGLNMKLQGLHGREVVFGAVDAGEARPGTRGVLRGVPGAPGRSQPTARRSSSTAVHPVLTDHVTLQNKRGVLNN